MKILFISHDATQTGAPFALLQELNYIKVHRQDVYFELLLLAGGPLMDQFNELCIVHKGWRNHNLLFRFLNKYNNHKIEKPYLYLFKKGQFDVIYANSIVSFNVAIEIKNKFEISLIGHVHEAENWFFSANLKKEQLNEFDKLIAVSELTANNLMDIYKVPSNKIVIQHPISYWIDSYINNRIRINPISLYPDKFLIGFFCNGGWWKATDLIPLVMKNYYDKYPLSNCEFVIVGYIDELTRYHLDYDLRKMNVQRSIHWIGCVDTPLDYHARFNLFLLLSREESFSLAAQEAAFMGTPVIGFENATGATEWIRKGAGSLVPYMDFDSISEEINRYHINEKYRENVGNRARDIITDLYKKDSQMTNLMESINSFINSPN